MASTAQNSAANSSASALSSEAIAKASMESALASAESAKNSAEQALSTTPEGYNELVAKVGLMDIVKSTDYTYPNTKPGGLRLLELVGATVQNGEPSPDNPIAIENVGDCVEMMQGYWNTSASDFVVGEGHISNKRLLPCKQGDVIKLIVEDEVENVLIRCFDINGTRLDVTKDTDGNTYSAIAPSGSNTFGFVIVKSGLTPQTVGKISLTVNGKHVVQIVEHGKNLWRHGDISGKHELRYPLYVPKGTYTVSFVTNLSPNTTSNLQFFDVNGKNIVSPMFNNNTSKQSITVTLDRDTSLAGFYSSNQISIMDIQLEEGTAATPYEPYTEKVATIFLDEPLKATPDGTKDVLFRENGLCKIARYVKEKPLSEVPGLTAWVNNAGTISVVSSSLTEDRVCSRDELMCNCNILKCFTNSKEVQDNFKIGLAFNSNTTYKNYMYICLPRDIIETVTLTALNEWFDSVGAVVQFALNTPKIEVLDTESQIASNGLETFKDMTYLEVDSKIKPSGIEVEYGTSQVGAYTLKSLLNTESNALKIEDAVNTMLLIGAQ